MSDGNPFAIDGVWLKSAFHTHTARSDGELDPAAHVRHHEWAGFDVCTITDHWTLTHEPSTKHCLVITGAELAADPYGEAFVDSEILAIGISDIPEDPGGDRSRWGPIDAYHYKTFPDLSAAARCIADQGGVSFIAHPYWSGMPLETLLAVEGTHGLELFNSSAERENLRGDSSLRVGPMPRTRSPPVGLRDRRLSLSGLRHRRRVDDGARGRAQRGGGARGAASRPPLRHERARARSTSSVDGDALEVRCSPARSIVMASRYETGWAVRADVRNRQEDATMLERDDRGPRGARAVRAADGAAVPAHRDRGRTRAQGMVEPDLSADLAFAHELADAGGRGDAVVVRPPAAGGAEGRRDAGDRGRSPGRAGDPRCHRGAIIRATPSSARKTGCRRARTDAGG